MNTETTTKRKYTKKDKSLEEKPIELIASKKTIKKKADVIETYSKVGLEVLKYFNGTNKDDGTAPLDLLLKGKKITYKTKWLIYKTNTKCHGKIMSEQRAMESGPSASDSFFDPKKYIAPHYVIAEKKSKKILYDSESFIDFCDFLGNL